MFVNYENILKENINWYNKVEPHGRTIGWFSGGAASAIACFLALEKYQNVVLFFTDTHLESDDTYRFMNDFQSVLGVHINIVSSTRFYEPEDVWFHYKGLNFATGAPCSTMLKREVRVKQVEDLESDYCQIFGFDFRHKEIKRAENIVKNHAETNPKFPLIEEEMDRDLIFKKLKFLGITPPKAYIHFNNNNCLGKDDSPKGGCIQGGVGYWKKIKEIYPHKYEYMAQIEHNLSKLKGQPVAICKDQRKGKNGALLFLKHNPDFPDIATIDDIKGRRPVGYFECNGFCGTKE